MGRKRGGRWYLQINYKMSGERKIFLRLARTLCFSPESQGTGKVGSLVSIWDFVCVVQDAQVYDTSSAMDEGGAVVFWVLKRFNITNSEM